MIEVTSLKLADIKVIKTKRYSDRRGFFSETYKEMDFVQAGIGARFVQDNHSISTEVGTVRGLHFQSDPMAQAKLVRAIRGRIFDVAVDIRRSSATFGKWAGVEISATDGRQIFIPKGFAHGFCTLEPNTEVIYKVSNYYSPQDDFGILWNDPDIAINWPLADGQVVLSDKDKLLPTLKHASQLFD